MVSSGNDSGSHIAFTVDDPLATEAIFLLNGLENNGLKKVVKVAAYNSLGAGPFSEPGVPIVFDQFGGRACHFYRFICGKIINHSDSKLKF